ncbi:MAG: hypothetical protein ACREAY_03790 [Nitrososphaera sp.]|uniref:hypothetical protein n=1 Tax=Nitrososphaera sp. TaxID=1971748 RepID=UPI003D6EF320
MEQVRCNICQVSIEVSAAKEHAMLQSHAEQKARLEGELLATKRAEYDRDSSVASQWATTLQ